MDMEEVYLRQIAENLKRQTELQEANNELLKDLLQKLRNILKNILFDGRTAL